ncbi:hypothetical protein DCS_01908 [Drechmeria coniospora]|uniref:Uncharacterized protein n=1 Tax=Drechmeria coniospora TaxID=98403 RepID=A0A151GUL6_DRECN|nr:hypothetical protein DCS_01908 [Drechmeria coniospora]KYK60770.1 hypothetical protein DCS_01908 [Drechmeria coniospora]
MKSSIVMGAVAVHQAAAFISMGAGDLAFVPVSQRPQNLLWQEMDACHKVDTRPVKGPNYPCVTQAWILHTCRSNGTSADHLNAHRDCMCGEGSSFFSDAKACSSCKTGYGLQGTAEDPFWHSFYDRLQNSFCKASTLNGDFSVYYNQADPTYHNIAPKGSPENPIDNKFGPHGVVEVSAYYPNAPAVQGPGKFTPVAPKDAASAPPTSGSAPVDGEPCVRAKINVEAGAAPAPVSTAVSVPTPANFTNGTTPNVQINININQYYFFLAGNCTNHFDGPALESYRFTCGPEQVVEKSVTKVETKEQKKMVESLPDAGSCGCLQNLPPQVAENKVVPAPAAPEHEGSPKGPKPSAAVVPPPAADDDEEIEVDVTVDTPKEKEQEPKKVAAHPVAPKESAAPKETAAPQGFKPVVKAGDSQAPTAGPRPGATRDNSTVPVIVSGAGLTGASALSAAVVAGVAALVAM